VRFDDEEMATLYTGYRDEAYVTLREQLEPNYRALNDELEGKPVPYLGDLEEWLLKSIPRPRRILDWGGGNGVNTPFKDADIDILDMAEKPLVCGKRVEQPKGPYDLIVCSNVLEHVSYPAEFLGLIKTHMQSDTVLFLEIPKENREQLVWHEHINRFTDESIRRLLDNCGLDVIEYKLFPPPRHGYEAIIMVTCKRRAL
jgi:hypothetical protein